MTAGWAAIELQDLDLGDVRRTRRVAQVVETLAAAPHASVPEASGSWAATKATYRLWDNPAVSAAAIRAAHTASTVRRLAGLDTVLVVQDTTELDLTPQPMRTAAGLPERPAPRTLHLHSDLVVSLAGRERKPALVDGTDAGGSGHSEQLPGGHGGRSRSRYLRPVRPTPAAGQ
jgi:hypothetical protein